ncbi:N-acetyltransferase DgcN [uncultured Shewanella sp.]|uniref:N-acetyltransferase DgcN n=1 Tax=uncultured Shewanella sp. TaxID=173975 RepID=UPI00261F3FE9|nr:N-acetyltransferase DgcN [uncultured Shewanella sp.]
MNIKKPYLLFLGDSEFAKTAQGICHWRGQDCVAQFRLEGCQVDLGLPEVSMQEAAERGAKTLVIGVAPHGGLLKESWLPHLKAALEAGMDIAAGLHTKIADIDMLQTAANIHGRQIWDIRHPKETFAVGDGDKRSGKRLLAVGTDCNVGKMFTTLAIEQEMHKRGMDATFRATGQTGIFIAGKGAAVDAVISDFISGAAESLSPDNHEQHWDLIEGQGSLHNPSYAGVSLGLLHGSQPDAIVLCHDPLRKHIVDLENYPIPPLQDAIDTALRAARLTNPNVQCVGVCVNTSKMTEGQAQELITSIGLEVGLPCVDPIRTGVGVIVDKLATL